MIVVVLVACRGEPAPRAPEARPVTSSHGPDRPVDARVITGVALDVSPADAEIEIDGDSVGVASSLPAVVVLEPGAHQLVVRHPGYEPYRAEFIISEGTERFIISLERTR